MNQTQPSQAKTSANLGMVVTILVNHPFARMDEAAAKVFAEQLMRFDLSELNNMHGAMVYGLPRALRERKPEYVHRDDAATPVPGILWEAANNGGLYMDKDTASYAGCTHVSCSGCGVHVEKRTTLCPVCLAKREVEKYAAMPRKAWDGTAMLYSGVTEDYYADLQAATYALSPGQTLADLRLVLCEPVYPSKVDTDHWSDDLPEDGDYNDLPQALQDSLDQLNKVIGECPPLSWRPGDYALELDTRVAVEPQEQPLEHKPGVVVPATFLRGAGAPLYCDVAPWFRQTSKHRVMELAVKLNWAGQLPGIGAKIAGELLDMANLLETDSGVTEVRVDPGQAMAWLRANWEKLWAEMLCGLNGAELRRVPASKGNQWFWARRDAKFVCEGRFETSVLAAEDYARFLKKVDIVSATAP